MADFEKIYEVALTEEQMRVMQNALEEYFRLRMGQDFDFALELATMGRDLSPHRPGHEKAFALAMQRRDHIRNAMKAVFNIAFEPVGYLNEKTPDMMIAECMWDAIRFARGKSRWDSPFHIGSEPTPRIEVVEDGTGAKKDKNKARGC